MKSMAFFTRPEMPPWYEGVAMITPSARASSATSVRANALRSLRPGSYGSCGISAAPNARVSQPIAAACASARPRARSVLDSGRVVPPRPTM